MKSILYSRTFWVALLLALGGAAVELVSTLTDAGVTVPGWALALVGVVQVWLRTQTRDGVYLRQGRDDGPAPEVEP